jgi:hypothetical protein
MKKIGMLSLAALLMGGIALTSCKKYEDGPALSLLTKKMRAVGVWEIESYYENDVDKTSDYRQLVDSETFELKKDGAYTSSVTNGSVTLSDNGTWEFINDKEEIKTQSNQSNSDPDTLVILRLKNKEMWVTEKTPGSVRQEWHYKAK